MSSRNVLSRITIDLPTESHRQLKTIAALHGKSMREVVIEAIAKHLNDQKKNSHDPERTAQESAHDHAIGAALKKYVAVLKKMKKISE